MSFGQVVGFLPLVLVDVYCIKLSKAIGTYGQLFPWILKPFYAHLIKKPQLYHLKLIWLLLILVSGLWLYVQTNSTQYFYQNFKSPTDSNSTQSHLQTQEFQDEDTFKSELQRNQDTLYRNIILFGSILQVLTVVLDVIVDYIQVCTLRQRSTLSWVKTIEVGLYKIGSLVGGSILLIFTTDININILVLCGLYLVVGGLALFVFKLPEIPQNNHIALDNEDSVVKTPSDPETQSLVDKSNSSSTKHISVNENLIKKTSSSRETSPTHSQSSCQSLPPYITALYKTKFFVLYLLTYKVCQGFLQKIFPQWMMNEANPPYSLDTANLICGLFSGLTSLAGTVVGGWVPTYVKKKHLELRNSEASKWTKIKNDIWFWLVMLILMCSCLVILVVTISQNKSMDQSSFNNNLLEISTSSPNNTTLSNNNSTNVSNLDHCKINFQSQVYKQSTAEKWIQSKNSSKLEFLYDGLGLVYNLFFIFLFIILTFVGGIITTLTFTEMTAKAQDTVDLKYANQYLSWLSMLEIVGKFFFAVFSGGLVEAFGYYNCYLLVTTVHLITIVSYILSKFEG